MLKTPSCQQGNLCKSTENIVADLRLSKRSEGSDQDVVILCIRCFNGYIDDVNWIVLCILKGTKIQNHWTWRKKNRRGKALLHTHSTHLDALFLIETRTGLCHWRTFQQRFYKTGEDLVKIPAKNKQCITGCKNKPIIIAKNKHKSRGWKKVQTKPTSWSLRNTEKPPWRPCAGMVATRLRPGRARCSVASFLTGLNHSLAERET